MIEAYIAKDFSPTPGGRYRSEGKYSGQEFREDILAPLLMKALCRGEKVKVILDETCGYGASFLEEAFGGLIRHNDMSKEVIRETLLFVSDDEPYLPDDISYYIDNAAVVKWASKGKYTQIICDEDDKSVGYQLRDDGSVLGELFFNERREEFTMSPTDVQHLRNFLRRVK